MGKIRIKFGPIEVDCEGSEQFLKEEFLDLIREVSILAKESGVQVMQAIPPAGIGSFAGAGNFGTLKTTEAIAARLTVGSGTDLALAAAIKLTIVDGKKEFSRQEITNEMKSAKSYFKETYTKNLSPSLKTLVTDQKFNPLGASSYALTANELNAVRSKLQDVGV